MGELQNWIDEEIILGEKELENSRFLIANGRAAWDAIKQALYTLNNQRLGHQSFLFDGEDLTWRPRVASLAWLADDGKYPRGSVVFTTRSFPDPPKSGGSWEVLMGISTRAMDNTKSVCWSISRMGGEIRDGERGLSGEAVAVLLCKTLKYGLLP